VTDRDDARRRILDRIRDANADRAGAPHPGDFPAAGAEDPSTSGASRLRRFADAVRAAGGEVVQLEDEGAAERWLVGFAGDFETAVVSPEVGKALDPGLPAAPASDADLGVSRAVGGAADTGTVLLSSREGRGLQLLPPTHLVWLRAREVCETLTAALEEVRRRPNGEAGVGSGRHGVGLAGSPEAGLPSAIALHSGPSKSADIGRIVVTGVHGPGRLVVAVVGDLAGSGRPGP